MKKYILFLLILFLAGFLSCSDNGTNESNNVVFEFGSYNGFCQGNCAHLFKYENGMVFRDDMDRFNDEQRIYSDESEDDLIAVADRLLNQFPQSLKDSDLQTYGCPGCLDQSIFFVRIEEKGMARIWYLDSIVQDDWDQELQDYVSLMQEELRKIIIF